jgi:hypothetical protein
MKSPRRGKAARSPSGPGAHQSRTDALLAQILLHVMGDAGQKKKALALRNANLSNAEIAGLMGTSPEVIGQVLYQARREGSGRSKKKKAVKRRRPRR